MVRSVGGECSACEFLSQTDLRNKTALFIPNFEMGGAAILYEYFTIRQNGSLVKWTFTAEDLGMGKTEYPALKMYRQARLSAYSLVITLPGSNAVPTLHSNVYEVIVDPPLSVCVGDIISLELPPISTARLLLTFVLTDSLPGINLDTSEDVEGMPLIRLKIGMIIVMPETQ